MENKLLMFSSLIFITNIVTAFYKKYYLHCILFICLTITSVSYHYDHSNIYIKILDIFFILAIILYIIYSLYNKTSRGNLNHIIVILITFLFTTFLFFYGYCVKNYCFHPDKYISSIYHCMLHIISSLGNHFITFL